MIHERSDDTFRPENVVSFRVDHGTWVGERGYDGERPRPPYPWDEAEHGSFAARLGAATLPCRQQGSASGVLAWHPVIHARSDDTFPSGSVVRSRVDHRASGAGTAGRAGPWEAARVLRELRGRHGGPHVGTRALALVLVLLLAAPLTLLIWHVVSVVLRPVF